MTKTELDAQLSTIVSNRYIYQQGRLVDSVEPQIARMITPAIREGLDKAIVKLKEVDLSEFQKSRYDDYVKWAQNELTQPFTDLTPDLKSAMGEVVSMSVSASQAILGWDAMIKTAGITAQTAKALVETPVGGATLSGWVESMGQTFATSVQRQTTAAMLEGQTYSQIVKGLLSETGALANGTRTEAITLARTYVQSVAQGAHNAVMDANSDIVSGRQWSAVFDNRTCSLCGPLDGRIYASAADAPPTPRHPRCRCLLLPVVKSWMEILGIQDTQEGQALMQQYDKYMNDEHPFSIREHYKIGDKAGQVKPVGTGGAPIEQAGTFSGTFEQWMKSYPSAAKDILGKQRYDLWSSGQVGLKDMLGQGNELIPVKVLKK